MIWDSRIRNPKSRNPKLSRVPNPAPGPRIPKPKVGFGICKSRIPKPKVGAQSPSPKPSTSMSKFSLVGACLLVKLPPDHLVLQGHIVLPAHCCSSQMAKLYDATGALGTCTRVSFRGQLLQICSGTMRHDLRKRHRNSELMSSGAVPSYTSANMCENPFMAMKG